MYYTKGMANPGQNVYMRDISYAIKEKVVAEGVTNYAVTADYLYYPIKYQTNTNGKIIEKNLKSGKELVIAGGIFNYMMADEGGLYVYDENKKAVIKMSIETKRKTYFKNISVTPEWIGTGPGRHAVMIDEEGKILELNGKTHKKRIVGEVKGSYSGMTTCKYSEPYLCYDNAEYELYRVDLTTGTQKRIFWLASIDELEKYADKETGSLDAFVSYCADYISIETSYEMGSEDFPKEHRNLLIFDYSGKLIENKKL